MPDALIAFGGNVGDVRETFARSIATLCDGRDIRLAARSSDYRTPPWGVTNQPAFVNCAIQVETELPPPDLLSRMQAVEAEFGRDRWHETRWGPRTLDIDLIAYGDLVLATAQLTLPHPRVLERAFVLAPLAEIVPQRLIGGLTVADALSRVDSGGIEKLPPR